MTMQKLLSKTRQAINDFNMINDNDKIAVGLLVEKIVSLFFIY